MADQINVQEEQEIRQQRLELLQTVVEYTPKAVQELKSLADEFYGIKQEDSDEYLDFVLENVNWEIQAMNATMDLLNENEVVFEKEKANQAVLDLNEALASKVDAKIAEVISNILIPLLEEFAAVAVQATADM